MHVHQSYKENPPPKWLNLSKFANFSYIAHDVKTTLTTFYHDILYNYVVTSRFYPPPPFHV